MIYAVKDLNEQVHLVTSLEGYETWTVIDKCDSIEGPIGLIGDKITSIDYINKRRDAYPSVELQLDMIFHDFDNWKKIIGDIKAKYPKA